MRRVVSRDPDSIDFDAAFYCPDTERYLNTIVNDTGRLLFGHRPLRFSVGHASYDAFLSAEVYFLWWRFCIFLDSCMVVPKLDKANQDCEGLKG